MRDWFATLREPRATGATGATAGLIACDASLSLSPDEVTQLGNHWATGATSSSADKASALPVAQVAHGLPGVSAGPATAEVEENCGFMGPVAQVAQVAQENDKAGIAAWDAEDWRAFFEERAGIGEHAASLSRTDAEKRAYECCVIEWLWRHPPPASGPEQCAHCGQPLGEPGRDGVPFLTGDGGHVWLHDGCHGDWTAQRRGEAEAALARLGLMPRDGGEV